MQTVPVRAQSSTGSENGPSTESPAAQATTRRTTLPDLVSLNALRAWHEGHTAREAATHSLEHVRDDLIQLFDVRG